MTAFGLILSAGLLLAFCILLGKVRPEHRFAVPLISAISIILGFAFSRLFYWICSRDIYSGQSIALLFRIRDGGLSMTGALMGAFAGAVVSGRLFHIKAGLIADQLSPAVCAFILFERAGEWLFLKTGYGPVVSAQSILTVTDAYGAPLLNVALLETIAAAVILIVLLLYRPSRQGDGFLLFLFLYGCLQILFESLRNDQHMKWDFVHAQQVFCGIAVIAALSVLSARKKRTLSCLIYSVVLAAVIVITELGVNSSGRMPLPFEFMKKNSGLWWYGLLTVMLISFATHGVRLLDKGGRER